MQRFRLSSTEGTSGNTTTENNTVYYVSGSGTENKRPNIISRPKSKPTPTSVTVSPTPVPSTTQQTQHQQQIVTTGTAAASSNNDSGTAQQPQQPQSAQTSSGSEATPTATATSTATAMEQIVTVSEGDSVGVPIQILDEAETAEFLRVNNAGIGNHQIITDASGAMTIETEDGNLMVILQNDDDDDTTTGTISFADSGHLLHNVQFQSGETTTVEVPTMEYADGETPETTSYILVQMDDQGNNILVPASAFSSQVNGIPTLTQVPVRTTQHQSYTTQNIRTTTQQQVQYHQPQTVVQEKGKPFRYVLPEGEEAVKLEDAPQYILNVLPAMPGSSQAYYTSKPRREPAVPRAKGPAKPRKPRPKKGQSAAGQPTAGQPVNTTGDPTTAEGAEGAPPQAIPVAAAAIAAVGTTVRPTTVTAGTSAATSSTGTGTQQGQQVSVQQSSPSKPQSGSAQVKPGYDPSTALTQKLESNQAEPETKSEGPPAPEGKEQPGVSSSGAGVGSTIISAALGNIVKTAVGPVVPAVLPVVEGPGNTSGAPIVAPGPGKAIGAPKVVSGPGNTSGAPVIAQGPGPAPTRIIVMGPKPSTSKDSVNGAPKKPVEEIVVTAFGTFKCTFCFKESTVRSHLVNHINRIHKGEKPFKCKVCNIGFQYSSSLKVHEKNHTVEKPYKCDFCECAFATDSNRNLHQKTVHTVQKDTLSMASTTPKLKFECATCKKVYCSKYNLLCHRLTHVDDFTKPIVCDFCKKECKTKAQLVNHVHTHKDAAGPFACNMCDMSFVSENRLQIHKVMHKDKKKMIVKVEPVVEGKTVSKVNISQRKNMKISTPTPRKKKERKDGSKEVFCSVCDDLFPNVEALEVHKLKSHGPGTAAKTYSKRDADQYETYVGKSVARKLAAQEEKAAQRKGGVKVAAMTVKKPAVGRKTRQASQSVSPKRGPGRPKRTSDDSKNAAKGRGAKSGRGGRRAPGRRPGRRRRPGRPARKKESSDEEDDVGSSDSESEDERKTPEKKQTPVKETSPKEKLAKPIKKRPLRTDPEPEPESSRETTPVQEPPEDPNIRKSQRKRGKNPYLEELKRKREKKIKARKNKEKESLRRASLSTEDKETSPTPTKRKRMAPTVSPKKVEKVSPSPKKEEEDSKPLAGSSRGGRKRKLTDVVIAAAIPKKRPYPKEIQDLIAGNDNSSTQQSNQESVKKEDTEKKSEGESSSEKSTGSSSEVKSDESKNSKESVVLKSEGAAEGGSSDKEILDRSEMDTQPVDIDPDFEGGPSKSTEDSGPPTSSSSEGQDDEKQEDGRVDTSVPMKKRKVIKTDRERDKDEVGKSFVNIFKQVKKDYVSSK